MKSAIAVWLLAFAWAGCGSARSGDTGTARADTAVEPSLTPVPDANPEYAVDSRPIDAASTTLDAGSLPDLFVSDSHSDGGSTVDTIAFDGLFASETGVDVCAMVANTTFAATQMDECGKLASGQFVGCYWVLLFKDDGIQRRVYWGHSDFEQMFTYTCDGWKLTAVDSPFGAPTYSAQYDPTTGTLHWDQLNYVRLTVDAGPPLDWPVSTDGF